MKRWDCAANYSLFRRVFSTLPPLLALEHCRNDPLHILCKYSDPAFLVKEQLGMRPSPMQWREYDYSTEKSGNDSGRRRCKVTGDWLNDKSQLDHEQGRTHRRGDHQGPYPVFLPLARREQDQQSFQSKAMIDSVWFFLKPSSEVTQTLLLRCDSRPRALCDSWLRSTYQTLPQEISQLRMTVSIFTRKPYSTRHWYRGHKKVIVQWPACWQSSTMAVKASIFLSSTRRFEKSC